MQINTNRKVMSLSWAWTWGIKTEFSRWHKAQVNSSSKADKQIIIRKIKLFTFDDLLLMSPLDFI